MKYIGMGYMPCNGYVPCQPAPLDSEAQEERIEGAMPCHNYKGEPSSAPHLTLTDSPSGGGETPAGCW